jgi:putative acyl-CoA dehydrogenase
MTPAAKYLVAKSAPSFIYETLECLGGNGYVEDFPMARLYREAPLNAIWEGSGNVVALDILRALRKDPEASAAVIDALAKICGSPGKAAAEAIKQLASGGEAESGARIIAEKLARVGALAALHEADGELAGAYAATRLAGAPRATFGACDLGTAQRVSGVGARFWPPEDDETALAQTPRLAPKEAGHRKEPTAMSHATKSYPIPCREADCLREPRDAALA